jgi:hypothetical protein
LYNPKSYWPLSSNRKYMIYKVNPLTMWLCANRWQLLNKVVPSMVKRSMEHHFFVPLVEATTFVAIFLSLDVKRWVSYFCFCFQIHHWKWESHHITIGIFKVHETLEVAMVI